MSSGTRIPGREEEEGNKGGRRGRARDRKGESVPSAWSPRVLSPRPCSVGVPLREGKGAGRRGEGLGRGERTPGQVRADGIKNRDFYAMR